MMTNKRTSLGFDDNDDGMDLSDFSPRSNVRMHPAADKEALQKAATKAGFHGRMPTVDQPKPQKKALTGRTEQLNVRVSQSFKDEFEALLNESRWTKGELLDRMMQAFKRERERD